MSVPGDLLEALGREARARLGRAGSETRLYRGRSIEELIPRIQAELGGDAIILRRREGLTGGVLGFFQHPYVEIEAMAAQPRLDVYDEEPPLAPPPAAAPLPSVSAAPAPTPAPAPAVPPATAAGRYAAGALAAQPPPAAAQGEDVSSAYVTARLAALARSGRATGPQPARRAASFDFQELLAREAPHTPPTSPPSAPAPQPERRTVAPGSHSRARAGVERSLTRLGVGPELAQELIEGAGAHVLPLAPRAGLAQAVREALAQRIPVAAPLPVSGAAIVVVGAGGSGKTTCAATLLGAYRRSSTLPAGCATVTRSGRGGELQMLLSPQVMRPVAASSTRALKALATARGQGLAIVDTPDVSPSDRTGVRELARLVAQIEPDRVVVALPATLGAAAAAQLLGALAPLKADSLAITHGDETDQIGVAVEAACRFGLAPEYLLERARGGGWRLRGLTPAQLAGSLLP